MIEIKEQAAEALKQTAHATAGAVGTGAAWGLSDAATGAAVFSGICTGIYMLSMAWLAFRKK